MPHGWSPITHAEHPNGVATVKILEIHAPSAPLFRCGWLKVFTRGRTRSSYLSFQNFSPSWMRSGREHVCSIPLTQERGYIVSIYLSKTKCPPFSTIQLESLETVLFSPCFFPLASQNPPHLSIRLDGVLKEKGTSECSKHWQWQCL